MYVFPGCMFSQRSIQRNYHHLPPLRKVNCTVNLKQGVSPPYERARRASPMKQQQVIDRDVEKVMDQGFVQESHSPYAAPVLVVGKKDGTFRVCYDYCRLNEVTIRDAFPMPNAEDLINTAGKEGGYFTYRKGSLNFSPKLT
jgi:hypothetical protein